MKKILVVHGPNLDLLGKREPEIYGHETLADINAAIEAEGASLGLSCVFFQSNYEGGIIDEKEFMDKLPEVATLAIGDACTGSNPRTPSQEDMEKLLKACFYGEDIDF